MLWKTHLAFGFLAGLVAMPFVNIGNVYIYFVLVFFAVILLFQIPMIFKIFRMKKDLDVLLLPFLIFSKNIISLFGYSLGLIYKITASRNENTISYSSS